MSEVVSEKAPLWKNPFVVAFVLGIVALTLLPFMQRVFLRAPKPLKVLSPWNFPTAQGEALSSKSLEGSVWVAGFAPALCDSACVKLQTHLKEVVRATSDLEKTVKVVTFVGKKNTTDELQPEMRQLPWPVVFATYAQLERFHSEFRQALWEFRGQEALGIAPSIEALPGYVLIDQTGSIRGFWRSDEVSRGNLINAARMLSRYGPNP